MRFRLSALFVSCGALLAAVPTACTFPVEVGASDGGKKPDAIVDYAFVCKSNIECSNLLNGAPAICVHNTSQTAEYCAPLESAACKLAPELSNWQDDASVVFAHVENSSLSAASAELWNASTFAFLEINQRMGGFPAISSGATKRPLVKLNCDHDGSNEDAITSHLANLGVPGIVGVSDSDGALKLAQKTIAANIFSVLPQATSPVLATLQDNGLIWRISPSAAYEVTLARKLVDRLESEVRSDLSLAPSAKIRVALVAKLDVFGKPLLAAFKSGFSFNAGTSNPTTADYLELPFDPANPASNVAAVTNSLVAFQPHVIVYLGGNEFFGGSAVPDRVEKAWTAPAFRPQWVFNSNAVDPAAVVLPLAQAAYPSIRTRLHGVMARSERRPLYENFVARFNGHFGHPAGTVTPNIQFSYDAAYFLAYAHYATLTQFPTGAQIVDGAKKLLPNGPNVKADVGPNFGDAVDMSDVFSALQSGAVIDLQGTSSELDFDPKTGEAPAMSAKIVETCFGQCVGASTTPSCVSGSATPVLKETGVSYDPVSDKLVGTYSCP